jgi:hypothetical protein
MIAATASALGEIDSVATGLRLARMESAMRDEPRFPVTREKGMQLESAVTQQVLTAAGTLESARAALWELIDDSQPFPEEISQSAIRYWAEVRRLRMWLGAYRELHNVPVLPIQTGE